MNRDHRVFYFAVAVAFASAIFAPGRVGAGPGDCEEFSAAAIDTCFVVWEAGSEFDALMDDIVCSDDATAPGISLSLVSSATTGVFAVLAADIAGIGTVAKAATLPTLAGCNAFVENVQVPELHICRAEVLRSFTWRQLCAQRVDRSP